MKYKAKKGCLLAFVVLLLVPSFLYLFFIFYSKLHTNSRVFVSDVKSVGRKLKMVETEHDSVLAMAFFRGENDDVGTKVHIHNNSFDVVSFVFSGDNDTIYIRDSREFYELFPPEEKKSHLVSPKNFKTATPVVSTLPSKCKVIPFSDSRFFVYNRDKCTYIPRDSTIHIIHLVHDIERANSYSLFDMTLKDTLVINLIEKK